MDHFLTASLVGNKMCDPFTSKNLIEGFAEGSYILATLQQQ